VPADDMTWAMAADIGARLAAAAVLGAALALHPFKLRRLNRGELDPDLIRAQILITISAALMVVVVGDSTARAFGLVGIGSFIRFRTVLKNPRDTATLFLLIGVGMAVGLRHYALAACVTAFLFLAFFFIEAGGTTARPAEPPLPEDDAL